MQLVITDSGMTSAESERLSLLKRKLRTYAAYIADPQFGSLHFGKSIHDCDFVVICARPATGQMLELDKWPLDQMPGESIRIMYSTLPADKISSSRQPAPENGLATDQSRAQGQLFKATYKNDLDAVKAAVAAGADVSRLDPLGQSAVGLAVFHSNAGMLQFLFDQGAAFPENSFGGRTFWIQAKAKGMDEIQPLLIGHGVRPKCSDYIVALIFRARWKLSGKLPARQAK